jgi:ABC-type xylose transport system permease subunit
MAWFATKTTFIALLMLTITFLLASYRGTPIVLIVLAVLVIVCPQGRRQRQRCRRPASSCSIGTGPRPERPA